MNIACSCHTSSDWRAWIDSYKCPVQFLSHNLWALLRWTIFLIEVFDDVEMGRKGKAATTSLSRQLTFPRGLHFTVRWLEQHPFHVSLSECVSCTLQKNVDVRDLYDAKKNHICNIYIETINCSLTVLCFPNLLAFLYRILRKCLRCLSWLVLG